MGARSECVGCGAVFEGCTAFDLHRVGTYNPMRRRCFSEVELVARGFWVSARGWWANPSTKPVEGSTAA